MHVTLLLVSQEATNDVVPNKKTKTLVERIVRRTVNRGRAAELMKDRQPAGTSRSRDGLMRWIEAPDQYPTLQLHAEGADKH
jgi:hypothetical protein